MTDSASSLSPSETVFDDECVDYKDTMPVERMRMRPWLEEQIDSCEIPGLKWVNKEKRVFQIPWMHAARHGWDLEKDAPLFMRWAIHTGKYQQGTDRPDPKTWKANFRCAMNSLPDIQEVKDRSIKKGTNAFRVYRMLSLEERHGKKGKKKTDKEGRKSKEKGSEHAPTGLSVGYLQFCHNGLSAAVNIHPEADGPIDYTTQEVKQETMETAVTDSASAIQVITSEQLPFVCQTVEVRTEGEGDQTVTSSHCYPLQISPVSSCGGSDTDSDTETTKGMQTVGARWLRNADCKRSVLRVSPPAPPSAFALPGITSFVNSSKQNFRVTSTRDPEPLISYSTHGWAPDYTTQNVHSTRAHSTQNTHNTHTYGSHGAGQHTHEMRASVIMKTSDVTSSSS